VLEHVSSPIASIGELFGVLRPGGAALLVFPEAVNAILRQDADLSRFGTRVQPTPCQSFDGRRFVLPMLNGLGGRHLRDLFRASSVVSIRRHVVLRSKPGWRVLTKTAARTWAPMWLRDGVTDNVSCILGKPLQPFSVN